MLRRGKYYIISHQVTNTNHHAYDDFEPKDDLYCLRSTSRSKDRLEGFDLADREGTI